MAKKLPATPAEISEVLGMVRIVAADLTARDEENLKTAGQILRGLADALEGAHAVGGPNPWHYGHRVGLALLQGGSSYL